MKNAVHSRTTRAFALWLFFAGLVTCQLAPLFGDEMVKNLDSNVVQLSMQYKLSRTGKNPVIRLVTLVPRDIENKQRVLDIRYSIQPARVFEANGSRYAEFVFVNPGKDIDIRINAHIELMRYDLSTLGNGQTPLTADFAEYLKDERYLEKNTPAIAAIAQGINGKDEMETVRKLYDYVTGTLKYKGYVPEDVGALRVLCDLRTGDCSDYSDALVALARAKNIPARTVDGFLTEYSDDNPRHTWVEIYTGQYGWVPFDPLLGSLGQASYDRLAPKYIYLSGVRNDALLNNFHFFTASYTGSPIRIKDTYHIRNVNDIIALTRR